MPAKEILQEARKLHKVSESLDALAQQHAPVAEGLTILAGTVRNSAALLEVLVALRLGPEPGLDAASNWINGAEVRDPQRRIPATGDRAELWGRDPI